MSSGGMTSTTANDYDSDMSDAEEEESGQELTGWLDEEEEEVEEKPKPAPVVMELKFNITLKSAYIMKNADLFYALSELEDWEFEKQSDEFQEEIMRSIILETYIPGQRIITEGEIGNDFFVIVASEDTARQAEVEVINENQLAGTEVFLTRLRRGQFFGQKFFLTRRANKRGATVRVPRDAQVDVVIGRITMEHFDKWATFRYLLLVKTVPLIQKLPRQERILILQNLQVRDFKDGEFIVRQGDIGDEFFIIQEGSVKVVERRPSPDKADTMIDVTLVTLREGHFFGEMSLVTDEPRVASVISVKNTICLCLSKQVFRNALSDESFSDVLTDALAKRKEIRKQREEKEDTNNLAASPGHLNSMASMRRNSIRSRTGSTSAQSEVSVSTTLSMSKMAGFKVINQYVVERELGKGAFGEVMLVRHQETDLLYAMKMIGRPNQSSWNDDASNSIRQEIAVMKRMKHQNVVALHEVIDDMNARKIFLIQEFMEGGALMPDAETCDPMDANLARKYFRDILRGVCYLHSEGIIHRDIKPQNMLLSGDGIVKIADFGAAVFTGAAEKVAFGGTPAFMAPELFLTNKNVDFTKSPGIDVFALGATLYYLVMGRPPWMAKNQIDLAKQISNIELQFPVTVDPHLRHLLRQMLAKDYRTRCNLDHIVMDDWVTFEGSDPLFEKDEFLLQEFTDFATVLEVEDTSSFGQPAPLAKALLVHESFVMRAMLHYQINTILQTVSVQASNAMETMDIIQSAMKTHPEQNFDFIFIDICLPDLVTGKQTVHALRSLGYRGHIIAMYSGEGEIPDKDFPATAIVRRPITTRELTLLLTRADSSESEMQAAGDILNEEYESAITVSAGVTAGSTSSRETVTPISIPEFDAYSRDVSVESANNKLGNADDEEEMQDFDNCNKLEDRVQQSRVSFDVSKHLQRKSGFVAFGTNDRQDSAGSFKGSIKVFSAKEDARRERREIAMRRSKLAQEYRDAKHTGDVKGNTERKSMLNLLRMQSKKSMYERKLSKARANGSDTSFGESGGKSIGVEKMSMGTIDDFIGNTIVDDGFSTGDLEEKDSDSDLELTDEEIQPLQHNDLDDLFDGLIVSKDSKANQRDLDIKEWDHVMIGVNLKGAINAPEHAYSAPLRIKYGMSENIVSRNYMEDRSYACATEADRVNHGLPPIAIFGVFDGHSGEYVAQYLQTHYAATFCAAYHALESKVDLALLPPDSGSYEARVAKVFEETNAKIDRKLLETDFERQQKNIKAGIKDMQTFAGSVSVVAVVMPALHVPGAVQVFISHVGDCRAVLSHDGVAAQLTEDHKATNKAEKARIESQGGTVHNGRVGGALGLAVARSFGDIVYKNFATCVGYTGDESLPGGIWSGNQFVISRPDFHHFIVEESVEFLILASDGLWDCFECQEAVNFVRKRLIVLKDTQKVAEELIQKAILRGTQDNTSAIIVVFNQ